MGYQPAKQDSELQADTNTGTTTIHEQLPNSQGENLCVEQFHDFACLSQ